MQRRIRNTFVFVLFVFFAISSGSSYGKNNTGVHAKDKELIFRLTKERKFDSIVEIFTEKSKQYNLSAPVLRKLVYANIMEEDYINALFFAEKLIETAKIQKDTSLIIDSYRFKTNALYYLRRLKEGAETCLEIEKYYRPQDSFDRANNYIYIGLFYTELEDMQKAYDAYRKVNVGIIKGSEIEGSYYNNFSNIFAHLKQFDSSISYSNKSLIINKRDNLEEGILMDYSNLASAYIDLMNYRTALAYVDSTKLFNRVDKTSWVYELIYENYYTAYLNLEEFDSAFVYLKRIKKLNEKRFQIKLDTEIEELQAATNREIRLVKKVELADRNLEKAKRQRLWITILFLLLAIVLGAVILLLRFRNLKARHNVTLTEQKLLRSQMTPHFIFNSLSVIQGMILSNESKNASKYLSKFSKLMRLILENSRTKFVSLEDEINAMKYYLELQSIRHKNKLKWHINISEGVNLDVLIPPMLIQPFIENALEHGFKQSKKCCEVSIKLKQDKEKITCNILDNGVGIEATLKAANKERCKKSLSIAITNERLDILSKELKVNANLEIIDRKLSGEQGTEVTIIIPYKTID